MRAFVQVLMAVLVQAFAAASAHAGEVVKVDISDLVFSPTKITVRAGDSIEWVNADFVDHTATANGGDLDLLIPAGNSARVQLNRAGTVDYYCRFHPAMMGTIHVVGPDQR
jgi:plastocyanin